ncbi:MAG: MFS transporter [Myxococcales bacterium]|nr:MFS transporter [Myxococcales bacterium]
MFFFLMCIVSAFILGRTVRDTLFLHRVDVDRLPFMYMVVAVSVAVVSYGYSHIADKLRRDLLIERSLTVFAGFLAGIWALMTVGVEGTWVYFVLYVAVEIVGALSIIQFWTFANDIFSAREAKRLFGVIGAGGVLSNIVCGFLIGSIAPRVGPQNLVLLCALLYAAAILIVRAVAVKAKADLELAVHRPKKSKLSVKTEGGRLFHSKHLKIIAGIVAVTFLTVSIVDFQFKVIARQTYSGEGELAAFFGYFYGFTGIIASLVQFFITGRLLERSGIVVALCVLPVAMLSGAGAMLLPFVAAVAAASIAKGAEVVFRYTVNDATMNLLYIPVPAHHRGRAKAFIDGILKPVSIGASGVVMFVLGRWVGADRLAHDLAWLDLVMLSVWVLMVVGIRKEYVRSLIDTLRSRRLDLSGAWSPVIDDGTKRALKDRLLSDDEAHILHALEILPSLDLDFSAELERLLTHASREVRIRALGLLGESGRLERVQAVERLMRDPEPEIRAAAIAAFCAIGRERAIRAASPFLEDPSVEVRAAAVAALIKHGGLDGILTAAESLKLFIHSDDAAYRHQAARVLGEIKVQSFFQPVLQLLQDPDRKVRLAAVEAAGDFGGRPLLDATNPIGPGFALTHGHTDSGAEQVARWAKNAKVVKVFNTTGVENMAQPRYGDARAAMCLCGDDEAARVLAAGLAADLGFEPLDAGPLANARLLEPAALLWIDLALRRGQGRGFAFGVLRR